MNKHATFVSIAIAASFLSACGSERSDSEAERDRARVLAAQAAIMQIQTGLDMYRLDNLRYPTEEDGLEVLVTGADGSRPVLQELRTDPWGNPYHYRNPGTHGAVDVFSYGRDGAPGGEGLDADIGNWE